MIIINLKFVIDVALINMLIFNGDQTGEIKLS